MRLPLRISVAAGQAELRGIEVEHLADRDANDAKHHPDHEAHGERQRADDQDRPCFFRLTDLRGHRCFSKGMHTMSPLWWWITIHHWHAAMASKELGRARAP